MVNASLPFRREFFLSAVLDRFAPEAIHGYQPTRDEMEALQAMKPGANAPPVKIELVLLGERESGKAQSAQAAALRPPNRKLT